MLEKKKEGVKKERKNLYAVHAILSVLSSFFPSPLSSPSLQFLTVARVGWVMCTCMMDFHIA